jgi:hypothetical protein
MVRQSPVGHRRRSRGHDRDEHRTLKAATVTAGLALPVRWPGPAGHPADPAAVGREMADRHRLRDHQPGRHPGHPPPSSPAGSVATGRSRPCTRSVLRRLRGLLREVAVTPVCLCFGRLARRHVLPAGREKPQQPRQAARRPLTAPVTGLAVLSDSVRERRDRLIPLTVLCQDPAGLTSALPE